MKRSCSSTTAAFPALPVNRPGLPEVAYRIGDYDRFRNDMLRRLASSVPLERLTSRETDDPSIALIDAWACVLDTLTFYQERIAQESYLTTAHERFSVLHLARLVGYELRPGCAASTFVSFTIKSLPETVAATVPGVATLPHSQRPEPAGMPRNVALEPGIKIQSLPLPGQLPQIFETVDAIDACPQWNSMKPLLRRGFEKIGSGVRTMVIQGTATDCQPGRSIAVERGSSLFIGQISSVVVDPIANTTTITARTKEPATSPDLPLALGQITSLPQAPDDATIANAVIPRQWRQEELEAYCRRVSLAPETMEAWINNCTTLTGDAAGVCAYLMRVDAGLFGNVAPRYDSLQDTIKDLLPAPWNFTSGRLSSYAETFSSHGATLSAIDLDGVYPLAPEKFVAVRTDKDDWVRYVPKDTLQVSRSDYLIAGKVTRLTIANSGRFGASGDTFSGINIRTTRVLGDPRELTITALPFDGAVTANSILLDRAYLGLHTGRHVSIRGRLSGGSKSFVGEVAVLSAVTLESGHTRLTFEKNLRYKYITDTITINANTARCTHGESRREILGSGDASRTFQRFSLKQGPLTYVEAATPSGVKSTLEIRINDIIWKEVDSLYGHGPAERIYTTRRAQGNVTMVEFGDGITGSRIPSGTDNIVALYRSGIGAAGTVAAGRLSMLLSRPAGLDSADNPVDARGGADPETLDQSRSTVPLRSFTLDRVVTLGDYEFFARSFAGVAKAVATPIVCNHSRGVLVTIIGDNGATIDPDSDLYNYLLRALGAAGDPRVPVRLASCRPVYFDVTAQIITDSTFVPDAVLREAAETLRRNYSFISSRIGMPVHSADMIATLQTVPGVTAVTKPALYRSGLGITQAVETLYAATPQSSGFSMTAGAELLLIENITIGKDPDVYI